jgi:hypothetical protein
MAISFDDINSLEEQGFEGFQTVYDLWLAKCQPIPEKPGVYLVLRDADGPPNYLDKSRAGLYKQQSLTVPVSDLESNWVENALVIYIGKAGGPGIAQGLKSRIRKYVNSGFGSKAQRRGGKLIWQGLARMLEDCRGDDYTHCCRK